MYSTVGRYQEEHGHIVGISSEGNLKSSFEFSTANVYDRSTPLLTLLRSLSQQGEASVDLVSREMGCEEPSPTQGGGNSSIFLDDNQGPVVLVWNGMLPGEQESGMVCFQENRRVSPNRERATLRRV